MDIAKIAYKYINKLINIDELIKELSNLNLDELELLITKLKQISSSIPNEIDEIEQKRIKEIDNLLYMSKSFTCDDEDMYNKLMDVRRNLEDQRKITKDGGKLYDSVVNELKKDKIVSNNFENLTDDEMYDLITEYIYVPLSPKINQKKFNALADVGIKRKNMEGLWRLAFNYTKRNMNFDKIINYFIEYKDIYYIVELISALDEELDINKLVTKIKNTNDEKFYKDFIEDLETTLPYYKDKIKELKTT